MSDFKAIHNYYSQMPEKIEQARHILKRSMTLTEKILFSHLVKIKKETEDRVKKALLSAKLLS